MKRALSSSVTKKVASSERPIGELSPKEKPREYESISTEMTLVKEMAGKLAHKPPIHSSDVIYTGIQPRSKTAVSKLDRQQREQPEVILISDSPETQPVAPVVTDMEIRSPPLNFKTRFDKKWVDGLKAEHHESHRQQKLEVSKAEKLLEESLRHEEEIEREIEERVKQLNLTLNAAEVSLVPLTQSQLEMVYNAFIPQPPDEVLSEAFNISIKRRDIATLKGPEWLNDEIINFYFNLIADRSKKHSNLPKVHVMSSFFYPSLVANGYGRVKRWTKKVNIFNMDLILLPVHLGIHWCLAVIDFRKCCIRYYDSMKGVNQQCLQVLANYLPQESQDKLKKSFSMNGWQYETVQEIPEQMNGSDCGVFSCKFAEYVSRDAPIDFSQEHMPFFRLRMVYEILNKTLL
jgi:sentrin-specific protease 1